ncbi:MAG: AMP-binding protein [Acidimicrobiia bacterium]
MTEPIPAGAEVVAEPTSLPGWLLRQAETRPKAVALRVKELGRWLEISWAEYAGRVASVGRALVHQGVGTGDRVAIVSDNRVEWLLTDLAVQGLGAVSVGLFETSDAAELASLIERAGVTVAIVENEEQFDKLVEVADRVALRHLVIIDPRGIQRLEGPASSFEALEALGNPEAVQLRAGDVRSWQTLVGALDPDAVATIVFTPGTCGDSKGVQLTHANLVSAANAGVDALGLRADDEIVSSLPLCDISERILIVAHAVRAGATVNFGEGGPALVNDLREVQPTVVQGTPRLWERLRGTVETGLRVAGHIKRTATRMAGGDGQSSSGAVANALVMRPLRKRLGLGRTRVALSVGDSAPPELVGWWQSVGVPLRATYALCETAGVATLASAGQEAAGTAGGAVPGVELRIDGAGADGEVLVRGPVVFAGYIDSKSAPAATRDAEGWLHTGDLGALAGDGALTIAGRASDRVSTSTGHNVDPRVIELRLEASPHVRSAIIVGDGRPHLGALLAIDGVVVGDWAAAHGVPYTTYRTLTERPEVRELLSRVVDEANAALVDADQVGCFGLLSQELDVEDGTLTPTLKVRRKAAAERHAELVDAMYGSDRGGQSP